MEVDPESLILTGGARIIRDEDDLNELYDCKCGIEDSYDGECACLTRWREKEKEEEEEFPKAQENPTQA